MSVFNKILRAGEGKSLKELEALVVAVNDRATPDVSSWNAIMDELNPGQPVKIDVVVKVQDSEQPLYFFLRKSE